MLEQSIPHLPLVPTMRLTIANTAPEKRDRIHKVKHDG